MVSKYRITGLESEDFRSQKQASAVSETGNRDFLRGPNNSNTRRFNKTAGYGNRVLIQSWISMVRK